jgi:hypothetical protein
MSSDPTPSEGTPAASHFVLRAKRQLASSVACSRSFPVDRAVREHQLASRLIGILQDRQRDVSHHLLAMSFSELRSLIERDVTADRFAERAQHRPARNIDRGE